MSLKILKKVGKIALAVGVGVSLVGCGVTQEDVNKVSRENVVLANQLAELNTQLQEQSQLALSQAEVVALKGEIETIKAELGTVKTELTEKDLEIQKFNEEIIAEIEAKEGYLIDEVLIGESFGKILTDKHVALFDGKVSFNGDDYEAEEKLVLKDLMMETNGDFESEVFLTMEEGSVVYEFKISDKLDTGEIREEETLVFDLLGEEVEVNKWEEDEVTLTKGMEFRLTLGETTVLVVDGVTYEVNLDYVDDDEAKFIVNGEVTKKLGKDDTYQLADNSEIMLTDIDYQGYAGGIAGAEFKIGSDLKIELEDGEEYEEDSMWNWKVTENSIGLVLNTELVDIDEDEDFKAVASGESVMLPNDYKTISFLGLTEEKVGEYSFKLVTKNNKEYVKLSGEFTYGMSDYERLYVDASGFYDRDLELVSEGAVELEGTEFDLVLFEGASLWIDNIELSLDLSGISVSGEPISDVDQDYLTEYGVLIDNPEDSIDSESVTLSIPEEELSGAVEIK